MKLEQLVRNILERAIEDDLVAPMENFDDPDPQSRMDEELGGCVAVLRQMLNKGELPRAPHWTAME